LQRTAEPYPSKQMNSIKGIYQKSNYSIRT